ncbi:hypothetical protein O6H91_12G098200 [Diphasiastrum complanatum]|uniref:Uncharacterized protein n=1 Tax=Diphasiastrum complanatum TaxID=34168 RepID=A0ACC2C530_DIPCM|nr:hypothetical protein O6H91_12G098200 [Diphasiastrum complanatum]
MGRNRSRSYSRSRSPPPRRRHYDDVSRSSRGRDRGSGSRHQSLPCGLLVRNIPRDSRPEDLRIPFEKFGPVKDVYLPKDYYSGEPRGFGFVQYMEPNDAADAKYNMDGQIVGGREISVVFAEENRKKPSEMRVRDLSRGGSWGRRRYGGDSFRRHSPPRSPGRRFRARLRSRSPPSRRRSPSPTPEARSSRSRSPSRERYSQGHDKRVSEQ